MNEFKGTPGPWTADECRYGWAVCAYGSGEVVVRTEDAEGRYGTIAKEADAILIAASPDLLNALRTLADAAESRGITCDAARAAIAKALGRQEVGK